MSAASFCNRLPLHRLSFLANSVTMLSDLLNKPMECRLLLKRHICGQHPDNGFDFFARIAMSLADYFQFQFGIWNRLLCATAIDWTVFGLLRPTNV